MQVVVTLDVRVNGLVLMMITDNCNMLATVSHQATVRASHQV